MKTILYLLLAATCIIACDNDDDYTKEVFTPDAFDGEWLLYDEETSLSATEVAFISKGNSYKCKTYIDINQAPKLYESYNGFYVYIKDSNSLRIKALGEKNGWQHTYNFEVKNVSPYSMLLVNKEFNSYDVYYRIVKSIETLAGNAIDKSYLSESNFPANEFISLNPNVATVDEMGNIVTKGSGITYIIAKSGDEKIAVKVTVKSMVDTYAELIYDATLTEIKEMFGEPSQTVKASETSVGLIYNNPSFDISLKAIQINIDDWTQKVTMIQTLYNNETTFISDVSFLKQNFNEIKLDVVIFCDAEEFSETRVHINPYEQEGNHYILYGSTYFLWINKHY